jgi:PEP-CTERM motif-containing protein
MTVRLVETASVASTPDALEATLRSVEKGVCMRRVSLALALAALLPVAARADPVSMTVQTASGGFSQSGAIVTQRTLSLGTINMSGVDSVGLVAVSGLHTWVNYPVSFLLEGLGSFDSLRIEILDPEDGDDALDPAVQPSYIPVGFSTSNDLDGFSFAQDGGLERSAKWAGGAATVVANEKTNVGDILLFSGLSGTDSAVVRFGLRDSAGDRGFLLRFSALDSVSAIANPEPASMALMGSGLVGLIGVYRRRQRTGTRARPESA